MKNLITGIVIGICVAITGFHVWFYYNVASQVQKNSAAIYQITDFINKSIQQSQSGQTQPVETKPTK